MKKLKSFKSRNFAVALLLLCWCLNTSFIAPAKSSAICAVSAYGIKDGWYTATVKYNNMKTYYNATYTLNVQVESNSVTVIDFGNGGSVHSGINNSGYFYSGGYLSFETDFNGNVTAAYTTVSVSDSDGYRYYKVRIE